jgi:hypothetical protein
MVNVENFLQDYNFDEAYLGSILIEFSDRKDKAVRDLIGSVATGDVNVVVDSEVGSSRKKRLREQTKDLQILDKVEDESSVLAFELNQ